MAKLHRQGRRLAFQALFEAEFGRATAAAALARRVGTREVRARQTPAAEVRYAEKLIAGVTREQVSLDAAIAQVAPAHPVSALGVVDRVVLRIALYELLLNNAAAPGAEGALGAVPLGAVINEAVELAKTYGSDASRRFVNGVLGTVSRERLPGSAEQPETEASRGAV